jgi:acetoin utilization deacetylase AcuC-like enzyme
MKPPVVFDPGFTFDWPGHVFPTGKYRDLAETLIERRMLDDFRIPGPATREELLTCHTEEYLDRLLAITEGEAAWDPRFECPVTRSVLDAFVLSTGGTILAARVALEEGWAVNVGGGFHHAYPDHGEGFCLLNDVPVAARVMREEGLAPRSLVVDLDVHQGNGTAVMAAGDPDLFALSIHQQNNYPRKETSDLDVGLPDLADDSLYLDVLENALGKARERFSCDLLFYLAGADPYAEDRLGGLALTTDGLAARDRVVFDFAERWGTPVVAVLAGGYASRNEDVVEIHFNMVRELLRRWERARAG